MDADRHRNRDEDQWDDEAVVVGLAMERAVDDVGYHDKVHQEVEIEHDRVPTQDRPDVDVAHRRNEVPEPLRTANVHQHEEQTHDDGAEGQQFAEDGDLPDRLPVVDVGGNDEDDGGGRHADKKREVADVEPPAHLVPHRRQHETGRRLAGVPSTPDAINTARNVSHVQ